MRRWTPLALLGAALLSPSSPLAQQANGEPDRPLDAASRAEVIEGVLEGLRAAYVFPDKAAAMERDVREREQRGEYERIGSSLELADTLTAHLQAISQDKHLRVRFSPDPLPPPGPGGKPGPAQLRRQEERLRSINFGFERVERLPGNVGYLDLRGFTDAETGEETVAAAMSFLANTDALIVDLRRNGGGSPKMVALISSYLFGPEPVHLNSLYWRPQDRTDHFYTRAQVAGTRYGPQKPVYILTSKRTFSAAEEFTYNLKNLERARVVGETTGGGAHPGGMRRVHDHFSVFVPSGRAINPVTQTNWEGTGVTPHVSVPQQEALRTAHLEIARELLGQATDPQRRRLLERVIRDLERGETSER